MKIDIESISEVKKKIIVKIPEERIQKEVNEALDRAQQQAVIPGFRKGKAPRGMLEKKYGKALEDEVCQDLIKSSLTQAIQDNQLEPITVSEMTKPNRIVGNGFSFEASVEVRPQIDPKDYSGIKLEKSKEKVQDKDVQAVLDNLADTHSVLKPKETKKPVKGDYVSMIVERLDKDGKSTEKETPAEQLHMVGHQDARKEIDDAILSMNIDDFQDVTLTHEHKDESGKAHKHEEKVRLTLKSIKTKILPDMNDEFAKTVGPYDSLDALKKQIQEDLEKQMEERNKVDNAKKIIAEVLKKNPTTLPDTLVENELVQLRQEMFNHMVQTGVTKLPEDFSEEKMNKELRPEAERRIHEQLLLAAIAKKEKIEVTGEEVEVKLAQYAEMMKRPVGEVRKQFTENGRMASVQFQILAQKTLDFLLGQATIK